MNRVILTGRVTADPRYSVVGDEKIPRAMFAVAVNRGYAKQGEKQIADFPNIVCWRKTAEWAHAYLTRGTGILVDGTLQTRSYTGEDGMKRYVTEVIADRLEFHGSKRPENGPGAEDAPPAPDQRERVDDFAVVDDDELPF